MKPKRILKNALGIAATGIALGYGAKIANEAGSPSTASALGTMSAGLPIVGGLYMAGEVMGEVNKIGKIGKRRRI